MIEQRDEELSRIYRDADGPRPPQRVDDNILAASQRVAGPRRAGFAHRWGVPVALAATVLVTSTLALMVYERQSGLDATAPQVPRAGRPEKVSPAVPKRADPPAKSPPAESRAGPLEKPPPAEPPSAAPAPAAPVPQAAAPLDRAKQRTVETALSSERRATGQSARVPEIPRGVEILRKSEEVKPAPSVAAPVANARAGAIPPQPPVSDAQRVFDAQQQIRSTLAPAAARAAGALRESATTSQGAEVVRGLTPAAAVAYAKERTPEKWLDDIRKLRLEGKMAEADRELAEFKKRYPDYRLPGDLP